MDKELQPNVIAYEARPVTTLVFVLSKRSEEGEADCSAKRTYAMALDPQSARTEFLPVQWNFEYSSQAKANVLKSSRLFGAPAAVSNVVLNSSIGMSYMDKIAYNDPKRRPGLLAAVGRACSETHRR